MEEIDTLGRSGSPPPQSKEESTSVSLAEGKADGVDDGLLKLSAMQPQLMATEEATSASAPPLEKRRSYLDYCLEEGEKEKVAAILDDPETKDWLSSPQKEIVPTTVLERESRISSYTVPGALRVSGNSSGNTSPVQLNDAALQSANNSALELHHAVENRGLAVAKAVDEEEPPDLPLAEDISGERNIPTEKWKTRVAVGVLCLVVVGLVILVAVLLSTGGEKESEEPVLPRSLSPSPGPTSFEAYALSIFEDYTLRAIMDEPESAQAQAYQWLLEDDMYNPLLSQDRTLQRFILATLYFATGGGQWKSNNHWLNHTVHECDWYNNKDFAMKGQRTYLYPGYMAEFFPPQEGPLPPKCDPTSDLVQHLWLDQNNLGGAALPLELYLLTSLQTLSIGSGNHLHGPISSHIGQLTALEGLVMDYLKTDGGSIPTEIGLLTRLKGMSLGYNNHIGTLPTELGRLTHLQTYLVGGNPQLKGRLPELRKYPKLRWIAFNVCDLTGTLPTEIGQMKYLEWIVFGGNRLDGTIPSELGLLPNILMTSLFGNQLKGALPSELGLMTSSTLMSFRENLLSRTIPSQMGLLTNLTVALSLHDNPGLTGPIPTELGLLTNLYSLTFTNNNHTSSIPSELGRLTSLGRLRLGNNSLTGTIPASLSSLEQLYAFDIQDNAMLSGTVPEDLCHINGSCIPHSLRVPCSEGTPFTFDCTDLLCGCGCCGGAANANQPANGTDG